MSLIQLNLRSGMTLLRSPPGNLIFIIVYTCLKEQCCQRSYICRSSYNFGRRSNADLKRFWVTRCCQGQVINNYH